VAYETAHVREGEVRGNLPRIGLGLLRQRRQLEFDFIVAPGPILNQSRSLSKVRTNWRLQPTAILFCEWATRNCASASPCAIKHVNGTRKEIPSHFKLNDQREVRFELATYDKSVPLVIDPVLVYSTYLGGTRTDYGTGIAVDASGYFYVVGGYYQL
jgi:hypothetical protein